MLPLTEFQNLIQMLNTVKKCVIFFYFEKCANFRKMNISEGYFTQLKQNFSMWLALWLVLCVVV